MDATRFDRLSRFFARRASRRSAMLGLGSGAALALAALPAPEGSVAQNEAGTPATQAATPAPAPGAVTFVGSWLTTVMPSGGASLPSLTTCGFDGTLIVSRPPVVPATSGAATQSVFSSTGQGVWAWTGEQVVTTIVVVFLQADQQGHALGSQTIRATDQLGPDGQTFHGEGVLTIRDPNGRVVSTSTLTAQGTRLAVQPSPRQEVDRSPPAQS